MVGYLSPPLRRLRLPLPLLRTRMAQPKTAETKQHALKEFEQVLRKASEKKASDLHLKAGLPPIVRVNGSLFYLGGDPGAPLTRMTHQILSIFAHALMTPKQWDRYENGEEIDLGFEVNGVGRFRINICQQRSHPRFVCRYIPDLVPSIADLNLPDSINLLLEAQRGMILVTGATGSGKSTTLASIIDLLATNRSCHIITIEDPIEFIFKDRKSVVTQREIGLDSRSFSHALKYALRQDPDVILVGEMRDEETIRMAITAAETGHLVLSTLHTLDSAETVNRILSSVAPTMQQQIRSQLSSTLVGVISQRLLRGADGLGRIPAIEILINNQRVRDMILDPMRTADIEKVIEESSHFGMQSFDQSLMTLFRKGYIDKEEALNHCSNLHDFQLKLEGITSGDVWRNKEEVGETRAIQVKKILEEEPAEDPSIEIEEPSMPKKR